jgi:osmoprotectant transport system permease protein
VDKLVSSPRVALRALTAAGILLVSVSSWALPDLRVGSDLSTESNVLAEIIRQTALQGGEANVTHELGMGDPAETLAALRKGTIDVYPIAADALTAGKQSDTSQPDFAALNRELAPMSLGVSVPLLKKRRYALAMPELTAATLEIRTISDALRQPQLRYGLSPRFMLDKMGLERLRKQQRKIIVGEVDRFGLDNALKNKTVDVIDLDPTDPSIVKNDLRVLEDDKSYFANYHVVLLHRLDVATRFPATWARLQLLENALTEKILLMLNGKVESGRKTTPDAVAEFLSLRLTVENEIETSVNGKKPAATGEMPQASVASGPGLLQSTQRHLALVFTALLLSLIVGVPLGALAYSRPLFGRLVARALTLMDIVPFLALLVICVWLLRTLGALPALCAVFLYGLIPILSQTRLGLEQIPRDLRDAATLQSLTGFARFRLVDLPLAMPAIVTGLRRSAVLNVGTAAVAALAGAGGYGETMIAGLAEENFGKMLAGAIPAVLLAAVLHVAFGFIARIVTPAGVKS